MNIERRETKQGLRILLKRGRKNIPDSRRFDAHNQASEELRHLFVEYDLVLSYSSFGNEFCTKEINRLLALEKKLVLPKVYEQEMKIYRVGDIDRDLVMNRWRIMEPDPLKCEEICPLMIPFVLVPAVAFDKNNHRIGYGGGYYDRFLANLSQNTLFLGIGYKEQLAVEEIPYEDTDVPLSKVLLY